MPLAPVDFARQTLPGAAMAVVLPYCDGDVSDQQGQHFYDDTRYAAKDDVLRTSLLVMGANHNFFNSEWTPGVSQAPSNDDWGVDDDPVCGSSSPQRLTAAEQRAVGAAYVSGFFASTSAARSSSVRCSTAPAGVPPRPVAPWSTPRPAALVRAHRPGPARRSLVLGDPGLEVGVLRRRG